jgi:hypothetical protein
MTAKEILLKIKAAFEGPIPPPAAPPVPPAPATPIAKTYKLQDGVTEISITQAGETPAVGDTVMIGGAPAPANTYALQDGSAIVVDAAGVITAYTAAMAAPPVPAPAPPPPAPTPAVPVTLSAEDFQAMLAKFAIGSTEDRLGNMEIMLKALMECNFGYEIRKGQEAAAIEAYKENLAPLQSSLESATAKLQTAFEKAEAQQETINKHQQTIKDLFELVEQLVETPTADPVTLTGRKKEQFDKSSARDERLSKIAEAIKKQKALA